MDRSGVKVLLLTAVLAVLSACTDGRNIDITRAGAKAVPGKDNAAAIQKAIDKLSALGGGTVTVPAGEFLTGPIELKSGVELHLEMGAKLLGVADIDAYEKAHWVSPEGNKSPHSALIYANYQENIAVTGLGTIDGQGGDPAFNVGKADPGGRPMIILFRECRNVVVKDVRLENSAHWVEYYTDCEGVRVSGIKVYSHCNYNNDGIDIESKDVVVENCIFDCEDDAICLKGAGERLCENVSVSNCVAASNCNAIKLGTGSSTGYRNVTVSNVTIRRASEDNFRHWSTKIKGITAPTTVISGIAVEVVDGGICENINISNIAMRDVQTPIFIRMGRRGIQPEKSTLRAVTISGVTAVSESMMSSSITGVPGLYPEDIYLSDIDITSPGGGTVEMTKIPVPEAEDSYPENRKLGHSLPASGLYIRHANNVFLSNVRFHFREPDARPLIVTEDCKNVVCR
jgi:polygalacturonase